MMNFIGNEAIGFGMETESIFIKFAIKLRLAYVHV